MCPSGADYFDVNYIKMKFYLTNRFSSKGDTGCLSMMAVNQREKLKPGVYPCNECAVESLYNFKHGKVFHDGMDDTVQEKLLSAIENHLIYGTVTECKLYLNREQIIEIMRKHFFHLKKKQTISFWLITQNKKIGVVSIYRFRVWND